MRIDFHPLAAARRTAARVGRTRHGWSAVTADGTLLATTPFRGATLALLPRLGVQATPGRPGAIHRAEARGTDFQRRVWRACRGIPRGRTLSYAELARRIGCGSPRAVGQALARNPLCRLIPCHRVVPAKGRGGFAWGTELRDRWLRMEQR